MGGPPKSILAISDLTLGGSTDRADVPIGNAQQSFCSSGTDGSNPVPSSAESANHRFLSSRQAITCAGTYQRLQGRRVAADIAIWHRKVRDNGRRYGREHRPADR